MNWLGCCVRQLAWPWIAVSTRGILEPMATKKSSKWWTVELIKKLWNISWDLWDQCNEALHNPQNNHDNILDSRINNRVCILFDTRPMAIPRDAFGLFCHTLDNLLQHSMTYKEQWVTSVEVKKKKKKHHDYGTYLSKQCSMRRWLGLED